jgi:hypothetical protein
MRKTGYLLAVLAILMNLCACSKEEEKTQDVTQAAQRDVIRDPLHGGPYPTLLTVHAQFETVTGPDGKSKSQPGPAKLCLVRLTPDGWEEMIVEDFDSNVFHKAIAFDPDGKGPGILTIGATDAYLKCWRWRENQWEETVLWNPVFGGKWNRLRDIEAGDVTGNGQPELVIATHDQGVVGVLMKKGDTWDIMELDKEPETFVHEIEIGDIDGDGLNEFFTTPTLPNKATFVSQPGKIMMYKWNGTAFDKTVIDEFENRHAKEILVARLSDKGTAQLFSSIEAETEKDETDTTVIVEPVKIYHYDFTGGKPKAVEIATLEKDSQCRFLTCGDVDQDGARELVASGMKTGLWMLKNDGKGNWEKTLIDKDSSGYEHATYISDLDGDGREEIYVAADDQHSLRRYLWEDGTFRREELFPIPDGTITWNLTTGTF